MTPKYSASDIANYFLFKAQKEDQELLSNLKLQKLIYYAQGLHLAIDGESLFGETIVAWNYGPVVPSLYYQFKEYGAGGIPADEKLNPSYIDKDTADFLDEVYEAFGQFSAIRLMEITHSDQCWQEAGIGNVISCDSMRRCLKKYLKND
jgi:uncharacterized phage-associated protein